MASRFNRVGDALVDFHALLGDKGVVTTPQDIAPYVTEWRGRLVGTTQAVVKPQTTEQVAGVLKIASHHRIAMVPQGGNTGLVGGQIPSGDGTEVVLSLERMNRIRCVDSRNNTLVAEAGCVLADVKQAATTARRLFPLSLASQESCQLGGVLSTNAGGHNVVGYGMARQLVLGLEVVLANGRILHGLRTVRKDNTGYDLKQLFIGSEGTLGVITAAALILFPVFHHGTTALLGLEDIHKANDLFSYLMEHGDITLTSYEFFSRHGLEMVLRHIPKTQDPFATNHGWYVLVETNTPCLQALEKAHEAGLVGDSVVANSDAQAAALWKLRESLSMAQKKDGASIKHDISVPVSRVADFITLATQRVRDVLFEARPLPFGHMGDGNVHFNISQPKNMTAKDFLAYRARLEKVVYACVREFDGSLSAEHGVGRFKLAAVAGDRTGVEKDLMLAIKKTLDPHGILNPGRML